MLILVFRLADAFGQSPYFQAYTLLKKNDPVQVESIMKDRTGFMWFGTNKGLFRFDGISTRRYTTTDSLAFDHVTALAQDSTGRIWIGHRNGQLSVFENDAVKKFEFPEGDATGHVSDILFATDGTMWFSTHNDGLYYFNEHLYRLDEADGMPDIFVYDLEEGNDGTIWAGTDRGVAVCTRKGKKVSIEVLDYKSGFPDNIIRKIRRSADDRMWLASEDAGVFSYNTADASVTPLVPGWDMGRIADFLILDDEFWIGNVAHGVVVFNESDKRVKTYGPGQGLTTLYADGEGSVWVGSRNGLNRSLGRHITFIDDPALSHDRNVYALTVDKDNNIWFSNDEGLFRRSFDKNGNVDVQQYLTTAPYNRYHVISLFTDSEGHVWCGFYGQGAVRINPATGAVTRFDKQISNGNVLNISGDGTRVWMATLSGASMVDLANNLAVTNYDRSKGLDCDYVYQVFVDSKKRTWFASDREGVAMLDDKGFHKMVGSLSAKAVYGLAEDATGAIWANVQEDGLYKFDGQEFRPAQVLRNINVNELSSDAAGNLVAVHDLGIDVYNPATSTVHRLDNEIGFGDRQPNLNATARSGNGDLYFGTNRGVVIYSKANLRDAKPVATIDKFRVFNKYKTLSDDLSLSYNENNITITFLGFWYQDPAGVEFQYKLENYDVDWISTADRSAVFSSLSPGSYTFRLRASADGNFEGASEDSVRFIITPPFWRTTLFYLLVGITLAFGTYTYVQRRERNLLRDKVELEERVAERTMEIVRKNEEIQAQAEEIKAINESLEKRVAERTFELERKNKALEDYAFINAHNLRSPVASILGLVNLLSLMRHENEAKEVVEHMKISAERLDEVVRTITESIEKSDQFESFRKDEEEGID